MELDPPDGGNERLVQRGSSGDLGPGNGSATTQPLVEINLTERGYGATLKAEVDSE